MSAYMNQCNLQLFLVQGGVGGKQFVYKLRTSSSLEEEMLRYVNSGIDNKVKMHRWVARAAKNPLKSICPISQKMANIV